MKAAGAALLAASLVAGCALTPQQQALMTVACNVDGVIMPLGQQVVSGLGPAGATAAGVDTLLVHPLVVQGCAALNGKPVAVPATVAPVAPTSPPAKPIS